MRARNDFAVFILTHGRADNMKTVDALRKANYSGKIYFIVDNEDKMLDLYKQNFGEENVIVFDKLEASYHSDVCDNKKERNIVLYARNECHRIAKELGLTYFLELDDDYTNFRSRVEIGDKLGSVYIRDFDAIVDVMLEFLDTTNAITVAMAQTGDFIGGKTSHLWRVVLGQKAMNSFFCRTDKPFKFVGRINEDTTMYCLEGMRGNLVFTPRDVSLDQEQTQLQSGGLTDSYLSLGTYIKSFYTVMNCPSFVVVDTVGALHPRFHHKINWDNAVPKIISSVYKK